MLRKTGKTNTKCALFALGCILAAVPATAEAASSSESMVLNQYEKVLAPAKIEVDRNAGAIEGFLSTTRQKLTTNKMERDQILQDLTFMIDGNQYGELTPRALMLRADIHQQDGDIHLALVDWLRVKTVFGSSGYAGKARNLAAHAIENDKFKRDRELLTAILKKSSNEKISYQYARLLYSLSDLTGTFFLETLEHECRAFLANSRSHELAPMVQMALAKNLGMTDVRQAMFQYQNLIAVYPHSSFVPDAMLAIADYDQERLSKPNEAIAEYQQIMNRYPNSEAARKANLNLAMTYEKHFRDENKAIEVLKQLVKRYPRTPEASTGGESLGRLYERTKQYDQAVSLYRNMPNISRDNTVIVASLGKASDIAETKLEDFRKTIDIDNQICQSYPKNDECAEAHYKSGNTYEKKLSDSKRAIAEYQAVVKHFPNHYLAKKASSRIKALSGGGSGLGLF